MEAHVAELTKQLKSAKASLAEARKADRLAKRKSPPKVDNTKLADLKVALDVPRVWNWKVSNRAGKMYITITQVEYAREFVHFPPPYKTIETFFPNAHLTSGGCGEYTFRLNP